MSGWQTPAAAPVNEDAITVSVLARFTPNSKDYMGELRGAQIVRGEALFRHLVGHPTENVAALINDPSWADEERRIAKELARAQTKKERDAIKARIPAIVPARFQGSRRNKIECLDRQVVGHDFDELAAGSFEDACRKIVEMLPDRFLAIHTTATERNPDGTWRLRAYELLDRAVTPDEWDARVKPHMRALGEGDASALDCARLLYLPVRTAGYRSLVVEGPRTRLDTLPLAVPTTPAPEKAQTTPAPVLRDTAAKLLGEHFPPPKKRADARLALVGACWHDGLTQEAASAFVKAVYAHVSDRGDVTDAELVSMVARAYQRGAAKEKVAGWTKLGEHIAPAIISAARGMLGDAAANAQFIDSMRTPPAHAESGVRITSKRPTVAERARKIGGAGIRLQTGFPSVDVATRGGILLRKVAVVGGAPGAGKTATIVQWAWRWLCQGYHVSVLCADEEADAILIRFGQLAGLSRDLLEAGDPDEREKLAAWAEAVPLDLIDGDEDDATIEAVSEDLHARAAGEPSVLAVDSIQTARTKEAPPKGADMRARTNVVVRALKAAAKVDGHLVVATSELSKAAYRNRDQADNINSLSAFKESGDIEYGVGLAIVLTSRPGTSEIVDGAVVKNRLGPGKPDLLLRLDHGRASVVETTPGAVVSADPLFGVKSEVLAIVEGARGTPLSKGYLIEKVGGRAANVRRAVDELVDSKQLIHDRAGGVRKPWAGEAGGIDGAT